MRQQYDPELKQRAIERCADVGAAQAARELDLDRGVVSSWYSRSGQAARHSEQTRAAIEANKLSRQQRVSRLADRMLEEAETEIQRLREPRTEHKVAGNGDHVTWTEPEPMPADRRNIATTAAILIDKSQLLAGEATSRTETLTPDSARQDIGRLRDELAERRRKREPGAA